MKSKVKINLIDEEAGQDQQYYGGEQEMSSGQQAMVGCLSCVLGLPSMVFAGMGLNQWSKRAQYNYGAMVP